MVRAWLHRLLESPPIYRLTQAVVGLGQGDLHRVYDEEFASARGRILDVGCGPEPDTPFAGGTRVGLDVNLRYVARYVRRSEPGMRCLGIVASASRLPFRTGAFDECRSAAVLHHLPDAAAAAALREMRRALGPGGRLVVFDMVRPRSFAAAPVAWLLCRLDRGAWVRDEEALLALARAACAGEWSCRSFSYTWLRLRGAVLVLRRPRATDPLP